MHCSAAGPQCHIVIRGAVYFFLALAAVAHMLACASAKPGATGNVRAAARRTTWLVYAVDAAKTRGALISRKYNGNFRLSRKWRNRKWLA